MIVWHLYRGWMLRPDFIVWPPSHIDQIRWYSGTAHKIPSPAEYFYNGCKLHKSKGE